MKSVLMFLQCPKALDTKRIYYSEIWYEKELYLSYEKCEYNEIMEIEKKTTNISSTRSVLGKNTYRIQGYYSKLL